MPPEDIYAELDTLYSKIERVERCAAYDSRAEITSDRLYGQVDQLESWLSMDEWLTYQQYHDHSERKTVTHYLEFGL